MAASLFPFLLYLLFLLLLSSPTLSMAARCVPPSAPSTIVRPLATPDAEDYETVKPDQLNRKRLVFGGNEVKSCLPKGFRRSSAPSRFVNYHTSGGCSPTTDQSINNTP